jgi:hypothetical protein
MFRPRTYAALGVLAAIAVPAVAQAGGKTSTAHVWQNKSKSVACGYEIKTSGTPMVICSAKGIPRPKGVTGGDGGFVVIGKHNKPKTIVTFQDEFVNNNFVTLSNGTTWSGRGVTCTVAAKVKCTNESGHGFTIGNGKYKHF